VIPAVLEGVIKIDFILHCLTGLRVGGAAGGREIGGIENIVIRDPLTQEPYIPGSSLKGAMRSRYELYKGLPLSRKLAVQIHLCGDLDCDVCTVFGRMPELVEESAQQQSGRILNLTRLRVWDAFATEDTRRMWATFGSVEVKGENAIDRLTSRANPRFVERVVKGSEFECRMDFFILDGGRDAERLRVVFEALKLVEEDYLGAYGSRGYGRVSLRDFKVRTFKRDYFANPADPANVRQVFTGNRLSEALSKMNDVVEDVKNFLGLEG
jgi:CRISPR-associated protein Csm3